MVFRRRLGTAVNGSSAPLIQYRWNAVLKIGMKKMSKYEIK